MAQSGRCRRVGVATTRRRPTGSPHRRGLLPFARRWHDRWMKTAAAAAAHAGARAAHVGRHRLFAAADVGQRIGAAFPGRRTARIHVQGLVEHLQCRVEALVQEGLDVPSHRQGPGIARIELHRRLRVFVGQALVQREVAAQALAEAQVVPPGQVGMGLRIVGIEFDGAAKHVTSQREVGHVEVVEHRQAAQDAVVGAEAVGRALAYTRDLAASRRTMRIEASKPDSRIREPAECRAVCARSIVRAIRKLGDSPATLAATANKPCSGFAARARHVPDCEPWRRLAAASVQRPCHEIRADQPAGLRHAAVAGLHVRRQPRGRACRARSWRGRGHRGGGAQPGHRGGGRGHRRAETRAAGAERAAAQASCR